MNNIITRDQSKVLKGISILMVILTHANVFANAFEGIPVLQNATITSILCHMGMCTFLILSGYGVYLSFLSKGFNGYWNNKIINIFIPAAMIQLIYLIVRTVYIYINSGENQLDLGTLIPDIFCLSQNNSIDGSMWYLSYQFFSYIIFFAVFYIINNEKTKMIIFVAVWCVLLLPMVILWMHGFYLVFSFALGVIWGHISEKKELIIKKNAKCVIVILGIIVAIVYYQFYMRNTIIDNVATNIIAIALIFGVQLFHLEKSKALAFIGENSFYIYLLQGKIIFGSINYESYGRNTRLVSFLGLLILSIGTAFILKSLHKKMFFERK